MRCTTTHRQSSSENSKRVHSPGIRWRCRYSRRCCGCWRRATSRASGCGWAGGAPRPAGGSPTPPPLQTSSDSSTENPANIEIHRVNRIFRVEQICTQQSHTIFAILNKFDHSCIGGFLALPLQLNCVTFAKGGFPSHSTSEMLHTGSHTSVTHEREHCFAGFEKYQRNAAITFIPGAFRGTR